MATFDRSLPTRPVIAALCRDAIVLDAFIEVARNSPPAVTPINREAGFTPKRPPARVQEPRAEATVLSMSVPYQLGGTLTEQQRLIAQAQGLQPHARSMLDRIAIGPGSKVVDFGCGPLGILDLLSERVGSAGVVVGIEREHRFADMALKADGSAWLEKREHLGKQPFPRRGAAN